MKDPHPAAGDPVVSEGARRPGIASGGGTARGVPWYLVAVVLATLVLAVYGQVGGHAFIDFDDHLYVFENPRVSRGLTLEGVSWAFTTFHAWNWHPLTWLSHMLDVELFGPSPGWHHRVNVLLHLLNAEMLFLVFWRMTGGLWASAFVAALFGVHPLHVESVAWVAERKDVLSTLFWILTMGAYLRYVRRPETGRYLLVIATFALGLMCKPMLVTLPFVLLLLDFWPLGRLAAPPGTPPGPSWRSSMPAVSRLVREKVPLFLLSAASCAVTSLAQSRGGAVSSSEVLPFASRLANAAVSYSVYLVKTAWPSSLAVFYPHPATIQAGIPAWRIVASVLLLGGLSAVALRQGRQRPCLAAGWLWYVGSLIPVIGLVQVGAQAHADRYTYVPLIGVFVAAAWGIPPLLSGWRFRRVALGTAFGVSLLALSAAAWVQTGYWRDSVTLFSRALAVTERNWFAWNSLGTSYDRLGQSRRALACFREGLRINPGDAEAWYNLGVIYKKSGQHQEAVGCFREALRLKPDSVDAWNNLGISSARLGRQQEAIGHFREALRLEPGHVGALINMGASYYGLGRHREAIDRFREALRLEPDSVEAWFNLGVAYAQLGRHQDAVGCFREALRIKPDSAEAWNNLGVSSGKLGRQQEAIGYYREALRYKPDYVEARNNLLAATGDPGRSR